MQLLSNIFLTNDIQIPYLHDKLQGGRENYELRKYILGNLFKKYNTFPGSRIIYRNYTGDCIEDNNSIRIVSVELTY